MYEPHASETRLLGESVNCNPSSQSIICCPSDLCTYLAPICYPSSISLLPIQSVYLSSIYHLALSYLFICHLCVYGDMQRHREEETERGRKRLERKNETEKEKKRKERETRRTQLCKPSEPSVGVPAPAATSLSTTKVHLYKTELVFSTRKLQISSFKVLFI